MDWLTQEEADDRLWLIRRAFPRVMDWLTQEETDDKRWLIRRAFLRCAHEQWSSAHIIQWLKLSDVPVLLATNRGLASSHDLKAVIHSVLRHVSARLTEIGMWWGVRDARSRAHPFALANL